MEYWSDLLTFAALYTAVTLVMVLIKDYHDA
jgi:hypothetical protein